VYLSPPPTSPDINGCTDWIPDPAHTNPNDSLTVRIFWKITPAILETATTVWIAGEIDYVDRFGDAHHSGYGRRYVAQLPDNNLVFDESTTGMNYDRPMSKKKVKKYPIAVR
jgi:hypothetical protein